MNDVQTNDRGEFFAEGKLYHETLLVQNGETVTTAHEGPWLNCDGCNPVAVVSVPADLHAQTPLAVTLVALRVEWGEAKAQAKEIKERVDTATAQLKAAIAEASGNATRAALHVPGFKPMTLTYTEPWQFDMDALKASEPETYVKYAHKKSNGQWTLSESRVK